MGIGMHGRCLLVVLNLAKRWQQWSMFRLNTELTIPCCTLLVTSLQMGPQLKGHWANKSMNGDNPNPLTSQSATPEDLMDVLNQGPKGLGLY